MTAIADPARSARPSGAISSMVRLARIEVDVCKLERALVVWHSSFLVRGESTTDRRSARDPTETAGATVPR
jgi:hypothetical protein